MAARAPHDREVPIPGYSRPGSAFLLGFVRILGGGVFSVRRHPRWERLSDADLLAEDWAIVGRDISAAVERAAIETGVPADIAAANAHIVFADSR